MAAVTIEISEKLLAKLQQTGRPPQEVIVETLEYAFEHKSPLIHQELFSVENSDEGDERVEYIRPKRKQTPKAQDLPRSEVFRRLLEAGFVRSPEAYDSPAAQEWLALSEKERQQHIQAMDELYFPNSPASTYITESRR